MSATLSADGLYRYDLTRGEPPWMLWIMLNPSMADAEKNDPTLDACITFAERNRCNGVALVNLFAYRASKPTVLVQADDPVGPENSVYLNHWLHGVPRVAFRVVGWGAHKTAAAQAESFVRLAGSQTLYCVGTTKAGAPRHPLYVRRSTRLQRWPVPPVEKGTAPDEEKNR